MVVVGLVALVPLINPKPYDLSAASRQIIPYPSSSLGKSLILDAKKQTFEYNSGYDGRMNPESAMEATGSPRINASFAIDGAKGMAVTDSANKLDLRLTPKFDLFEGVKSDNQVVYKLEDRPGHLVYTAQISGVKEDIVLERATKNKLTFEYELTIKSGLEARLEKNGSIGVYGADAPVNGDVTTGSAKDAELLEKVRKNASKNTLLFTIPAPVVVESGRNVSVVKSRFELKGKRIKLIAENLKAAKYPLTIDPSIYVETAQRLMRGNNETNLDFDVDNELIQKGKLTGARFNSWTSSLALPDNRYSHSTAVYGGYIYTVGGNSGSAQTNTVYWAKFNTTTGAIEASNPGNGACASWCTSTDYNLPANREGHSLVAYNGYLYVIGGHTSTPATPANTVYVAKLGLNGEPALWHPTNPDQATWAYWYTESNTLTAARTYGSAVVYNSRIYYMGGFNAGGQTTVYSTTLDPNGTTNAWSTTGMIALPGTRFGHSAQVYNDRIYVVGGASSNSATSNVVYYMKLNSDGTMAGTAWATTTAMTTSSTASPRMSLGGSFTTIWGGYIYAAGGCSGVSVTSNVPSCATGVLSDLILASINADGTISDWQTVALPSSVTRSHYGLTAWRGTIYGVGGCTTTTCTSSASAVANYGVINQDGDASTVNTSSAPNAGNCLSGTTPAWQYCDLPPVDNNDVDGTGGRLAGGAYINNGFIYHVGGCTQVNANSICFNGNNTRVSNNMSYAQITADGKIQRVPASACTDKATNYDFYGSWCVYNPSSGGLNLGVGLAAFGTAVYQNTLYAIGGTTGSQWQENVWYMTPNTDGSPTAWTSQTFSAVGITDTVGLQTSPARGYSYVFTRANPSEVSTFPGNLYVIGGCTGPTSPADNGLNCDGALYNSVYKCKIATTGALATTGGNLCTKTGQLQIDSETGTGGDQGLGVMAGTSYANYVYLVGGQSPNQSERGQVLYAKIDNSNNIVAVSGSVWTVATNEISPVRRRGIAFGYNGYLYALAGYSGGGSLNDLLYAKINTSDGSIGTFVTSNVTVDARWDLRAVVNNGYVYTMAGCQTGAPPDLCTVMTGGVQIFQLYNNYSGSPAQYVYQTTGYAGGSTTPYAGDKLGHGSAVVNGYLYIAGGCTGTGDCTVTSDQVSYSKIDAFGYLGAWTNSGVLDGWRLPASRGWGQLEVVGGTLYFIGGQSTTNAVSTVYWTTPNASTGAITTWNTTTKGLGQSTADSRAAQARTKFGATVWNNRIYVVGGLTGMADNTASNVIFISPSLSSGGDITGDWVQNGVSTGSTSGTNFNIARSGLTAITYSNNLYILGGADASSNIMSDVQYAKITETSSGIYVSGWSYTTSLVDKLFGADGFAYNGFMYLFGGKASASVCETNTIAAPLSANTTIASGNNPTGIGDWFETNVKYNGSRYGASAAYYDGKAYLSGGACNSTLTYVGTADKMTHTTLLSQPQVAKYSRLIDTDTDVFPNSWLLNGLDNDIGARWRATYRSMHDLDTLVNPNEDCGTSSTMATMSTYGQTTNVGEVTLGKVNSYTAKDSTGGNINCARYFFIYLTIDSSQAYGYPEDVTRGPTIADLTLFFTADPSKRLKHGKTFTGGEQQPLDTPCRVSNDGGNSLYANCPLP